MLHSQRLINTAFREADAGLSYSSHLQAPWEVVDTVGDAAQTNVQVDHVKHGHVLQASSQPCCHYIALAGSLV
jgi:hypothetical protein